MAINDVEHCEHTEIHADLIEAARANMPAEDELYDLEICVCDIAELLNMTQSAISHQLRILKNAKLVKSRREGKQVFYFLADDHVRTIINQGLDHIEE